MDVNINYFQGNAIVYLLKDGDECFNRSFCVALKKGMTLEYIIRDDYIIFYIRNKDRLFQLINVFDIESDDYLNLNGITNIFINAYIMPRKFSMEVILSIYFDLNLASDKLINDACNYLSNSFSKEDNIKNYLSECLPFLNEITIPRDSKKYVVINGLKSNFGKEFSLFGLPPQRENKKGKMLTK